MPGKEQFMTELKMKEMQIPRKRRNRISVFDHV